MILSNRYTLFILIALFLATPFLQAQKTDSTPFIYGVITTKSNQKYEGAIRWGKEEMCWYDVFNSNKMDRPQISSANENAETFTWDIGSLWDDYHHSHNSYRSFACHFGDIDRLEFKSGSSVHLFLKNGHQFHLSGGSNDVNTSIYIYDYELGKVKLYWEKIAQVQFTSPPSYYEFPYSNPLYGRVKTSRKRVYEGFIKWDLEERQGEDLLDGDSADGDASIPFKNIARIDKKEQGCDVVLNSGRKIYLCRSNDVNSSNNGIGVYIDGIGSIEVPWKDFISVEFSSSVRSVPTYTSFATPNGIQGEVETFDDEIYTGYILFDLDEMWEPEILDAKDDNIIYRIPFANVVSIQPQNKDYALVRLKNGKSLFLGNAQDVSSRNAGILVYNVNKEDSKLLDWDTIYEIRLK